MALHKKNVTYSAHATRAARAAHAKGDKEFRKYDTSAIMPKTDKRPLIAIGIVLVLIMAAVAVFAFNSCSKPALVEEGQTVNIVVEEGEDAGTIATTLEEAHLIEKSQDFLDEVTRLEADAKLIPGTYTIEGGTSPEQIVQLLMVGPSATGNTLTVPEGMTLAATAAVVAQATDGRVSAEDFTAAASNASVYAQKYSFLKTVGDNSLEGFLFPMTYNLTGEDTADSIIRLMLDEFGKQTASLSLKYPEAHGLDFYDTVKLASIVEKEASDKMKIRKKVAAVFYNRLASDRPYLESDATTAYEVGHDPTGEEVHADTPYSTYTHQGLPPTPICSPSLDCLKAVCHPAKTKDMFFYFKTNKKGELEYFFSKTYEEHQKAIAS